MSLRPRRAGMRALSAYGIPVALCLALLLTLAPGAAFAQDATPEVTPEATQETPAAVESTPEATVEPTVEATAEATAEATVEPTAEPVVAPARVIGSGIAAPLFDALAAQAGVNLTTEVTGTNAGITDFCAGLAQGTLATRALTPAEQQICALNGVVFQEVLIAHSAAALIVNPANDFVECYTTSELAPIFTPAATATNWNQIASTNPDLTLTVALPSSNSPAYTIIDSLVDGDGLRVDAAPLGDEVAVVAAVAADRGTIGVVSLAQAEAAGDSVKLVQLNFGEAGCAAPSAATIEGRTYSAAQPILVYRNIVGSDDILGVVNTAVSDAAASTVSAANFTSPTVETLVLMREGLANAATGRLYTRTQTTFVIPSNVSGEIEMAGTAFQSSFISNFASAFTASYSGVTANSGFNGTVDGVRRFCNGEIDILTDTGALTQEALDNCTANNITPYTLSLGSDAVVLLRNSADTFAQCLTLPQLATIFSDASNATVMNWNQVDPAYSDVPLFVFESGLGAPEVNALLLTATSTNDPGRADAQINADPLYRAAATGVTSGVLSVYSWADYLTVIDSEQANVTPVQIDGGNGCIEPAEATLSDGTYPLARSLNLIVNRASLNKPQVQALLWFIFSDTNFASLQSSGLVGVTFGQLPEIRAQLEETFTQVSVEAQEAALAAAEATPEATAEATAQAGS